MVDASDSRWQEGAGRRFLLRTGTAAIPVAKLATVGKFLFGPVAGAAGDLLGQVAAGRDRISVQSMGISALGGLFAGGAGAIFRAATYARTGAAIGSAGAMGTWKFLISVTGILHETAGVCA